MCSGRVDLDFIFKAFAIGQDGVLIGGCHPGDCHYLSGNYKARRRVGILKTILDKSDLGRERVLLRWISASEGQRFAKVVNEFTEHIRELGPSPIKTKTSL